MLQNTIQKGCGQDRITHHLCPVRNLLVGRKDQGGCFVGITDKGEEPIGLSPGDRSIADFINNNELSFFQVFYPEAGCPVHLAIVQELNQVYHFLKADGIDLMRFCRYLIKCAKNY